MAGAATVRDVARLAGLGLVDTHRHLVALSDAGLVRWPILSSGRRMPGGIRPNVEVVRATNR